MLVNFHNELAPVHLEKVCDSDVTLHYPKKYAAEEEGYEEYVDLYKLHEEGYECHFIQKNCYGLRIKDSRINPDPAEEHFIVVKIYHRIFQTTKTYKYYIGPSISEQREAIFELMHKAVNENNKKWFYELAARLPQL